jgi:ketosteroid isomerase-like protein
MDPMTDRNVEGAIGRLMDDWVNAICEGDIERTIANRTDSIVMFDVPEPIQEKGIDAYRRTWELFFASIPPGPDRFRISELKIVADQEVAIAHGLLTIGGSEALCRLTVGLRKVEGQWSVFHEHHSMPIRLE